MSQAPAYLTAEITAPTTTSAFSIDLGGIVAYGSTAPSPAAFTLAVWNGSDQDITALSVVTYDSHAAGQTDTAEVTVTYAMSSVSVAAAANSKPGTQQFSPTAFSSGLLPNLKVTGTLAADASSGSIRVTVMLHEVDPAGGSSSSGVSLTNASGTITTGGTSQQLVAANSSRKYLLVVNLSTDTLWIRFGSTASAASEPSIPLNPAVAASSYGGGAFFMEGSAISTDAIQILGATTGDAFSAWEG